MAVSTAFRWRHRVLKAVTTDGIKLTGIVEADETFVPKSRKGDWAWKRAREGVPGAVPPGRKARKRGGKASRRSLSREQVPVLVATDRSGATVSAVLPAVTASAPASVLKPVIGTDARRVSDGCTSYRSCAAALGVTHEVLNQTVDERIRGMSQPIHDSRG